MKTTDVMALSDIGLSLYGRSQARTMYSRQAGSYLSQAQLNAEIGAFNIAVSDMASSQAVNATMLETRKMIGMQRVEFARRGISMDGSPSEVMSETYNTGIRKMQQEMLNADISRKKIGYSTLMAVTEGKNRADEAKYSAKMSNANIFKDLLDGVNTVRSMGATGSFGGFDIFSGLFG